ncbi:MAG: uracil-DNA glycosylase family protein, partial [Bacteroidota bacterium]|nr:uracil-DNA glycosylase family protein [Bacteroidota bacterium]
AGSHQKKGWEQFTDSVIHLVADKLEKVVFILWGNYAISKGEFIDANKHLVLKSVHPSPLSASRGFFGNHQFSATNKYLTENGKSPVQW